MYWLFDVAVVLYFVSEVLNLETFHPNNPSNSERKKKNYFLSLMTLVKYMALKLPQNKTIAVSQVIPRSEFQNPP